MFDRFGREITYLRISVTDRCNLRCRYCNPDNFIKWLPHSEILTFEEIEKVCLIASQLGIKKIRLTGGEPLVRPDLPKLIKMISSIENIEKICLTTNGVLLEEFAEDIIKSGLKHINISLDTLNREKFKSITGMDSFDRVWRGIEKAISIGFSPIKINTVVMAGINEDEITEIARLTLQYPLNVRFIEYMPLGCHTNWELSTVITADTIKQIVENNLGELIPVQRSELSGPASIYRLNNAKANIGFISPITRHFCNTCNRIRLTSDGKIRPCLFSDNEIDIKRALRENYNINEIYNILKSAIYLKPISHYLQKTKRKMSSIGG